MGDPGSREASPLLASQKPSGRAFTSWVLIATFIAVLGGTFQFGYNTGVINTPQDVIERSLSGCRHSENCTSTVTTVEWSTAVSMFAVGGLVGGLGSGPIISALGLRTVFALNNFILIAAALMMAFAPSIKLFTAGRFVVGIGSGVTTVITPKYLSEIAPVSVRGGITTLSQLGITLGILVAQSMGIHNALGTLSLWRYLLGFSLVPACLQLIFIFFVPESPRWLYLTKGNAADAKRQLLRLRANDVAVVESEMRDMEQEQQQQASVQSMSIVELLRARQLWKTLFIGITLQACQQLSGINAIFYFSASIFANANVNNADVATAIAGVVNVIMTVVSVALIDRLGRRLLLLGGLFGMAASYALLTVALHTEDKSSFMSYISVLAVLLVIVFFAVGPGGVPWLMVAELFPASAATSSMSLCVAFNWIFNFIVGISFTPLQDALGNNVFIPFIALCVVFGVFVRMMVPETKGKTIDEIQQELHPSRSYSVQSSARSM
eukprot:m.7788 g.7788  ORF g.7788 m.7788 type:complete len:495 (+) comp5302_c0_seq1:95-1579(+)